MTEAQNTHPSLQSLSIYVLFAVSGVRRLRHYVLEIFKFRTFHVEKFLDSLQKKVHPNYHREIRVECSSDNNLDRDGLQHTTFIDLYPV